MSNLTGVTKDMYPEGTIATADGLFGAEGEIVLAVAVTEAEMNDFNGTSSDLPATGDTTTSNASPVEEAPKVQKIATALKRKAKAKATAPKKKAWYKK